MSVTEMNEASAHAAGRPLRSLCAAGRTSSAGDNVVLRGLDPDVACTRSWSFGRAGFVDARAALCQPCWSGVDDGRFFGRRGHRRIRARTRIRSVSMGVGKFQHYNLLPHMSGWMTYRVGGPQGASDRIGAEG